MKNAEENGLKNRTWIYEEAMRHGADRVGAGSTASLAGKGNELPEDWEKTYPHVIVAAVRLSGGVLETIRKRPTPLYYHHYRQVNYYLDRLAIAIMQAIQPKGHRALPIPASQVLSWEKPAGHLSHRHMAVAAGLGWIGRNNLLVTPDYGARVRLISVLTDLPMEPEKPIDRDCGSCRDCLSACPIRAIRENPSDFNHQACYEQLDRFRRGPVGHHICGICVRACKGPPIRD